MQYLSAFLLAKLGGCENPTKSEIKKIISAAGAEFNEAQAESVIAPLSGKDIDSLITQGKSQLSSAPSAGAAPVSAASGNDASSSKSAPSKQAEKEKPKKEESEEELSLSLFD